MSIELNTYPIIEQAEIYQLEKITSEIINLKKLQITESGLQQNYTGMTILIRMSELSKFVHNTPYKRFVGRFINMINQVRVR